MRESVETRMPLDAAEQYMREQQYTEAERALLHTEFGAVTSEPDRQRYIGMVLQLAVQGRYQKMAACYQELIQAGEEACIDQFQKGFQRYLSGDLTACAEMAQLKQDDPFVVLCRLQVADKNDRDLVYALLDYLQTKVEFTGIPPCEDVLYWSVRLDHGMLQVMEQIQPDALAAVVKRLVAVHDDFAQFVLQWVENLHGSRQNLRQLYWLTELMTLTLIYSYAHHAKAEQQQRSDHPLREKISAETGMELFCQTAAALALLCRQLYCSDVWKEENIDLLPKLHRMAFHVTEAMRRKESKDFVGYLRYLKFAAIEYPLLSKPIQQLDQQLQSEIDAQKKAADEFRELAQQVKEQTAGLIARGEFKEAAKILEVYQAINPSDEEATDMYRMIRNKQDGTEPQ